MKQYLKNLLTALCGNNPFQMELERVREEYEKTADRVKQLEGLHEKVSGQIVDYQALIENLRQRLAEKDELLKRTKEEYQKRIKKYNELVSDLHEEKSSKAEEPKVARLRRRKPKKKKDEQ